MKKYLEIGKIVGTHALKGEVRVQPWADSGEFLLQFGIFYLNEGASSVKVVSSRVHKNMVIVKLKGVNSIEEADAMRGKVLYIDRADAQLPEGRYFIQDLIGLQVVDAENGTVYGVIDDVTQTLANDVYHVKAENGKIYYIAAVDQVLAGTDLEAGTVSIHAMKGMFDDED